MMILKAVSEKPYMKVIVYDTPMHRVSRFKSLEDVYDFLHTDREYEGENMSEYENASWEKRLEFVLDMDYEFKYPTKELIKEYEERYGEW